MIHMLHAQIHIPNKTAVIAATMKYGSPAANPAPIAITIAVGVDKQHTYANCLVHHLQTCGYY